MNLLRAAATVSGLTLLSRITGLVRENLTAVIFGASALTDAFFVAFRLPNLLRRLFAEGAFQQAFVPILSETRTNEPDQARILVDRVATGLFWAVLLVCIAAIVWAPTVVRLVAGGLERDPETFQVAVTMTRVMFPYILCMAMVALAAGILNTWRQFSVPAFTPVLLNLSVIGAALLLSRHFDPPVYALAAGVALGGILQLAIQIPALRRIGMLPRIGWNLRAAFGNPRSREILRLMAPAVLAVSAAQISLIINTNIASRLAPGSVSWVSYGDRLMEFPTALLGVALGTVLLPSLSRAAAADDTAEYNSLLDWGLRLCVVLAVPAMIGLAMMATPLTALLFHYGRFSAHDVAMTSLTVVGYSIGLLGQIAVKVLAPAYYARKNVRTPVLIALTVLVMTQLMNLVFVPIYMHAGLAVSIALASCFNALLLLFHLRRGAIYQPRPGWPRFLAQVLAGALAMAALLWFTVPQFDWIGLHQHKIQRIALVFGLLIAAAGLYLGMLALCGVRPRQFLRRTRA